MVFKSRRDRKFTVFMGSTIFLIILLILAPLLVDILDGNEKISFDDWLPPLILSVVIISFMVWTICDISYVFHEEFIKIKGGPLRTKILYQDISKISRTKNVWEGLRILSAWNGLEIHYKTGLLGSIKISPENEERFIEELKKRAPQLL